MPSFSSLHSRRQLLQHSGLGFGGLALNHLLSRQTLAKSSPPSETGLHFPAKVKRVIYLFQSGGPSQLETFDYKPLLNERRGEPLPDSVRQGQRLTGMSANQSILPMVGSKFPFSQQGESGTWISDRLPHTAKIVDQLTILKSMYTEAINHDPAITMLQTGNQLAGRPSIGSWLDYGLGSENENLPSFVVLITKGQGGQPLYSRLWGAGFLPTEHQGVQFRAGKEPVLFLNNPPGIDRQSRRNMLDALNQLHERQQQQSGDPELLARMARYEMAFRMQASIPEVTNTAEETEATFNLYGEDARKPGTFAANCLLARRLAERGVRFIQLYHQGWDQHGGLPKGLSNQCRSTDQASAALVTDLKQRGLLEETLVIWGGEFGRTNYSQGKLTAENYGRDHHPRCFTMWMAGGGLKPGISYGQTDEFGYNITENPVHVRDFHATLLHLMGIDHHRLSYRYQGLDARLTGVEPAKVVHEILA